MKTLVLAANAFLGHSITKQILEETNAKAFAMDIGYGRIAMFTHVRDGADALTRALRSEANHSAPTHSASCDLDRASP